MKISNLYFLEIFDAVALMAYNKVLPAQKHCLHFADVVNDNPVSGNTLWGQIASDYEAGVALKADLIRLGYDGFIYEDGCIEVGLITQAKEIAPHGN